MTKQIKLKQFAALLLILLLTITLLAGCSDTDDATDDNAAATNLTDAINTIAAETSNGADSDLYGAWDNDELMISYLFREDGVVEISSYEQITEATYSLDANGNISLNAADGITEGALIDPNRIEMNGMSGFFYPVDYPWYMPQEFSVEGAWDNDAEQVSFLFTENGEVLLSSYDEYITGTYSYDPVYRELIIYHEYGEYSGFVDDDENIHMDGFEDIFYTVAYPWYTPEDDNANAGSGGGIVAGTGIIEPFMQEVVDFAANLAFNGQSTSGVYEYGYMYPQDAALDFYNRSTGIVSSITDRSQYGILMVVGMDSADFNDFINNEGAAAQVLYAEILAHFALFDFVQTVELNIIHNQATGAMGTDDYYFTREWANTVAGGNIADFGYDAQGIADIFAATVLLNGANSVELNEPAMSGSGTELSQAELDAYNQQFSLFNADRSATNIVTNFFTSYYSQPSEMDISSFVYYLPDPNSSSFESGQDDEYNLLREHHHFYADASYTLDEALDMGINFRRVSQSFVQEVLTEYMNVSVDIFDSANDALYLEEYASYYNNPTDMGLDGFTADGGYREADGTVVLYHDYAILTLILIDGKEYIYSHQQPSSN